MSFDFTDCPNCKTKLRNGLLTSVTLLTDDKIDIINEYIENPSDAYCTKCGNELFFKYYTMLVQEKKKLTQDIYNLVDSIPVISIHTPLNWKYEILDMVTGQSTTGTGVISEISSSFTDLFGGQSGRYNQKLKNGENMCFAQLRKQALDLGGNAVIGTDIDYSEVGGQKGMLMVCMGGTAINIINIEVLGQDRAENILLLKELKERLDELNEYYVADEHQR
jgi:uncharacterized protein YbjQ (UPF0145 family)